MTAWEKHQTKAAVGGGINGFIESELGVVAEWGKSLGKAAYGRAFTEAASEGLEEGLQFMVSL